MIRTIRFFVGLISILLCLTTVTLWIRSYWRIDGIGHRPSSSLWYEVFSDRGRICFEKIQRDPYSPQPQWFLSHVTPNFAEDRYVPKILPWWTYSVSTSPKTFRLGAAAGGYVYDPFYNRLVPRSWHERWGVVSPPDCIVFIEPDAAAFWKWEDNYSRPGSAPVCTFHAFGTRVYEGNRRLPVFVSGRGYPAGTDDANTARLITIPHAYLAIPITLLASFLMIHPIRRFLRGRAGQCPACGYDLRASKERCPECGTPIRLGPALARRQFTGDDTPA
jgi:hypothetical protein